VNKKEIVGEDDASKPARKAAPASDAGLRAALAQAAEALAKASEALTAASRAMEARRSERVGPVEETTKSVDVAPAAAAAAAAASAAAAGVHATDPYVAQYGSLFAPEGSVTDPFDEDFDGREERYAHAEVHRREPASSRAANVKDPYVAQYSSLFAPEGSVTDLFDEDFDLREERYMHHPEVGGRLDSVEPPRVDKTASPSGMGSVKPAASSDSASPLTPPTPPTPPAPPTPPKKFLARSRIPTIRRFSTTAVALEVRHPIILWKITHAADGRDRGAAAIF